MVYRSERVVAGGGVIESPHDIPDADLDGVECTIDVEPTGIAQRLEVEIFLRHPSPTDLQVALKNPSGATAMLFNQTRIAGPELRLRFDSDDDDVLRSLLGGEARGAWTLRVRDLVGRDTGSLRSFGLRAEISLR